MKNVQRYAAYFLLLLLPVFTVQAETEAERRTRLETELQNVERQILTQSRLVEDKQLERQSLERDVSLIEGQIKQAQLGIHARSVAITQLTDQIGEKAVVLSILEEKLKSQNWVIRDYMVALLAKNNSAAAKKILKDQYAKETNAEVKADIKKV